MIKIKQIINYLKNNPFERLILQLSAVIVLVWFIVVFVFFRSNLRELKALKKSNKESVKQSEKVIEQQQKEIEKLKKDVVLHTILADSSIAKANRLSKKNILNQIEYEKISTNVSTFDDSDIIKFWANRKER